MDREFSVSMSVYLNDNPEHFHDALKSIINQTLIPSEVILVVDGPITIQVREVINQFKFECSYFKVVELSKNLGHGNARRVGLSNCTNNIVALMDSDDISVANRFELQFEFMLKNPQVSLVGGQIEEFEGNISNIISKREVPETDIQIKEYLKYRCPINQMTVMLRKDKVSEAGGYLDWFCNEDYYLWIRMHRARAIFHNLNKVLVRVRVDEKLYRRRRGRRYFVSEVKLQLLMFNLHLISIPILCFNVLSRFIVQCLTPPVFIKYIYKYLLRK